MGRLLFVESFLSGPDTSKLYSVSGMRVKLHTGAYLSVRPRGCTAVCVAREPDREVFAATRGGCTSFAPYM
jgi:hypothetical protein